MAREGAKGGRPRYGAGYTVASCLITFAAFLVLDGWFFANPFIARHFSVSLFFSFAPVVCLYLGWPAMVGALAAETVAAQVLGKAVYDPVLWFIGVIAYVALPYLFWYAIFRKAEDPYPRCSRARSLAVLFGLLIVSALILGLITPLCGGVVDSDGGYVWLVCTSTLPMSSISLTLGIVLLIVFEASPIEPRAPLWISTCYEQHSSLTLTQRIVLVFAALATVTIVGLILAIYVFIYQADTTGIVSFIQMITAALILGDIVIFVLWTFGVITISYLQNHFTIPIERLSALTRDFPKEMAEYQEAVDAGMKGAELAEAKARAADPVDMARLKPSGEVRWLVEDTDTMRASMVNYLDEMRSVAAENERVKTELDVASKIQQGVVPHDFTEIDEALKVQVAASMTPARDVGGDFYDAFRVDSEHLGVIMADVSGKGMPAALFMMRALAELREQMHAHPEDVGLALTRANQALCTNNAGMLFVTAFIGILDVETGILDFANAGHNPAWQLGEHGTWLKARKGLVLGMIETIAYTTEHLQLEPGGGLFLYTDGVTEAMTANDEQYSDARLDGELTKIEAAHGGEASSETLVDEVLADVHAFVAGAPQSDDITALAFRWLPE